MPTLDERIQALEARLGPAPLAAVPPMTIGEITDVPVPGSAIAANWAQEITGRILHRFADYPTLTGWNAPTGSRAITLSDGLEWRKVAAGWSQVTPWSGAAAGGALVDVSVGTANTLNIPPDYGPRLMLVSCFVRVHFTNTTACRVFLGIDGAAAAEWFMPATVQIASGGGDMEWNVAMAATTTLPINRAVPVTVTVQGSAPDINTLAGAQYNRLDALGGAAMSTHPPITIGELNDVPAPGSGVASAWAQEITNRIAHRFTNIADRTAKWPPGTAPQGALSITLDTGTMWILQAGAWVPLVTPAGPWLTPALLGSWVATAGQQVPQYRKIGDNVQLRGAISGGAMGSGTGAIQLPAGYRPPVIMNFACVAGNAFGTFDITSTGVLRPEFGANDGFNLTALFSTVV